MRVVNMVISSTPKMNAHEIKLTLVNKNAGYLSSLPIGTLVFQATSFQTTLF